MRGAGAGLVLFVVGGCAPAVQVNSALSMRAPECNASTTTQARGLLDIGVDAESANEYDAALSLDAPEKDITFDEVHVFFATNEDRGDAHQLGEVDGTPVSEANARVTAVSGTSATPSIVATLVTKGDAVLLQSEPFVAAALSAGDKATIVTHFTLHGKTAGGADVSSQPFTFPLDLCAGCLTEQPVCSDASGNPVAPVANPDVCFRGDDVPDFLCP